MLDITEGRRGCGERKPGGFYLVGEGNPVDCGKIPMVLVECPCCGHQYTFVRTAITWINADFITRAGCRSGKKCKECPGVNLPPDTKVGLMWVGKKFYPTAEHFIAEAKRMGVSRRIHSIGGSMAPRLPDFFKVGETVIYLASLNASQELHENGSIIEKPGVFYVFTPTAIEYIISGLESEEELQEMSDKGITLINLRKVEQPSLFESIPYNEEEE